MALIGAIDLRPLLGCSDRASAPRRVLRRFRERPLRTEPFPELTQTYSEAAESGTNAALGGRALGTVLGAFLRLRQRRGHRRQRWSWRDGGNWRHRGSRGIGGPGGTGGTNGSNFGSLTGTGPDTAIAGTTYVPTLATPIIGDVTCAVSWSFTIGEALTVGFLGDGTLDSVAALAAYSPPKGAETPRPRPKRRNGLIARSSRSSAVNKSRRRRARGAPAQARTRQGLRGKTEMTEDSTDGAREHDSGHEPQAPPAVRALEHVDVETAPHELRPAAIGRSPDLFRGRCR